MGNSLLSHYEKMRDGSSYGFDFRIDEAGNRRLFISETVRFDDQHQTNVLSISEDNIKKVTRLIRRIAKEAGDLIEDQDDENGISFSYKGEVTFEDFLSDFEGSKQAAAEKSKSLPKAGSLPENVGSRWTDEEEQWLLSEYLSEPNIKELAKLAMRKPGGIRARLKRFGIFDCEDPAERIEMILADWDNRDSYYNQRAK